jgi:hypothetical protein
LQNHGPIKEKLKKSSGNSIKLWLKSRTIQRTHIKCITKKLVIQPEEKPKDKNLNEKDLEDPVYASLIIIVIVIVTVFFSIGISKLQLHHPLFANDNQLNCRHCLPFRENTEYH